MLSVVCSNGWKTEIVVTPGNITMNVTILKNVKIIIYKTINVLKSSYVSIYEVAVRQNWPAKSISG